MKPATEGTPLLTADSVEAQDAALARSIAAQEIAVERERLAAAAATNATAAANNRTEAWNDYNRTRYEPYPYYYYGAWRPRPVVYRDPLYYEDRWCFCWMMFAFWFFFIAFILLIILLPYYLYDY